MKHSDKKHHAVTIRRGFTLIELLVVIAIIALLVSILLPSLQRAKELAKKTVCSTNLKNAGTGLFSYASENESKFPPLMYGNGNPTEYGPMWHQALGIYMQGQGAPFFGMPENNGWDYSADPMACPSWEPADSVGSWPWLVDSYGANYPQAFGYEQDPSPTWHVGSANLERTPGSMFLIADAGFYRCENPRASLGYPVNGALDTDFDNDGILDSLSAGGMIAAVGQYNGLRPRHNGELNFLLADSSVRSGTIVLWADNYNLENGELWGPHDPMDAR